MKLNAVDPGAAVAVILCLRRRWRRRSSTHGRARFFRFFSPMSGSTVGNPGLTHGDVLGIRWNECSVFLNKPREGPVTRAWMATGMGHQQSRQFILQSSSDFLIHSYLYTPPILWHFTVRTLGGGGGPEQHRGETLRWP